MFLDNVRMTSLHVRLLLGMLLRLPLLLWRQGECVSKAFSRATVEALVPFHDVDVAGVVWHGHYLKYLENARWALMARLDFGLDAMIASGYAWPIVEAHVKYVRPRVSAIGWRCRPRWSSGRTA